MKLFKWLFGKKNEHGTSTSSAAPEKPLSEEYIATLNQKGRELEKVGEVDQAVKMYELARENRVDTIHPYKRLAILYRKKEDTEKEMRAIESALANIDKESSAYEWFVNRKASLGK